MLKVYHSNIVHGTSQQKYVFTLSNMDQKQFIFYQISVGTKLEGQSCRLFQNTKH